MSLLLMASCSSENVLDNQGGDPLDETTVQEIVLGSGMSVSVNPRSRGIGAVGDTEGTNAWNGELVYIYGINTSATGDAQFYINAQTANTPAAVATGQLTWATPGVAYYYSGNDIMDFYGAHVDDAVTANEMPVAAGTNLSTTGYAVNVTFNGIQDLMVAGTDKAADITAANNAEQVTVADVAKLYSSWSARRKVVPNLIFNHLLTRLNFQAKCGTSPIPGVGANAIDMIKITKLEVVDVYNSGSLQIIPTATTAQGLTPTAKDAQNPVNFEVFNEGTGLLTALQPVNIVSSELVPVGADLLVYPEQSYKIVIHTEQDKNSDGTIQESEKTKTNWTIQLADGAPFVAGNMYDINIIIYGLEDIKVNASLTVWGDGGDITIDPDDIGNIPAGQ